MATMSAAPMTEERLAELRGRYGALSPAAEMFAEIDRLREEVVSGARPEPHGYVVVNIDADTEDYDMSVRDTTVYPDLALAQGEGIHEHTRNGLVETVRSSPSGARLIRRIYALMPVDPKDAQ